MFRYEAEIVEYINEIQENQEYSILLQEKLSSISMNLKNSVQYMTQAFKIEDAELSKLLLELSAEGLSNFELLSKVVKVLSGGGESNNFVEKVVLNENIVATGEPCTDLLSDIALEQQSKLIFESVCSLVEDPKLHKLICCLADQADEHSILLREAFNKIQREKAKEEIRTPKQARMCFGTINSEMGENSYEEFQQTAPAVLGGRA